MAGRPRIIAHRGRGGLGHEGNPGTGYSITDPGGLVLREDGSVEKGEFFATLLTGNWRFYRTKGGNWKEMTPREGARGHGFPDTFPLPEDEVVSRSLIGRSEPPPMARAVGQSLVDWLDATKDL